MQKLKLANILYFQVIIALLLGGLLGYLCPEIAIKLKPLGDIFIKLIRMLLAPIIFTTVVLGIAGMKNSSAAGRIGIKALIYFEIVTAMAMVLGLVVAHYFQPGVGLLPHSLGPLDNNSIAQYIGPTSSSTLATFIINCIPDTFISALAQGNILSVLLVAILFGFALLQIGEKATPVVRFLATISSILFVMIEFIMKMAPLAALGAIAYTVGHYGGHTLLLLGKFIGLFYLACLFFIFVVLGAIAWTNQFSLWKFLMAIKEELVIVFSLASTETVLPRMIQTLEKMGCGKSVVGLVLPAGYSFNLDGMSIYLTMAIVFIAQVFSVHLTLSQELMMIVMLLLISKGAANVTGGGFIALASAVTSMHTLPVEGLVILFGIDRLISEARSVTNFIGNGVATVVMAKWEGEFDAIAGKKIALASNNSQRFSLIFSFIFRRSVK